MDYKRSASVIPLHATQPVFPVSLVPKRLEILPPFTATSATFLVAWLFGDWLSTRVDLDLHDVAGVKKKSAGALDTPLNVRDGKVCGCLNLPASGRLNGERHRDVVILPVNSKDAGHLHLRSALRVHGAFYMLRCENDLRIFLALQNLLMHLLVAAFVVAVAARSVHDDCPACFPRSGIKTDMAALELKRPMNGVQCRIEREFDRSLRRIQVDS